MAVEHIQERPGALDATNPSDSVVVFDAKDPRNAQLSREDRIRMYYARELAAGNFDALAPRYRTSEQDSDNPWQDTLAADPLSDPKIGELASILKASGYQPEPESGD